jgi:CO dehydrogenase/acetyl-CoA synthase alpha subunit
MAISYTWDVKNVDTYPSHTDESDNTQSDVVYNVHWRLTGEDDANNDADGNPLSAGVYGSVGLDVSDLADFTSFADLTVADVQAWVEAAIGADQVQAYKDGIDAQIAEKLNPSSVSRVIGS